jgi:hypothetical protein
MSTQQLVAMTSNMNSTNTHCSAQPGQTTGSYLTTDGARAVSSSSSSFRRSSSLSSTASPQLETNTSEEDKTNEGAASQQQQPKPPLPRAARSKIYLDVPQWPDGGILAHVNIKFIRLQTDLKWSGFGTLSRTGTFSLPKGLPGRMVLFNSRFKSILACSLKRVEKLLHLHKIFVALKVNEILKKNAQYIGYGHSNPPSQDVTLICRRAKMSADRTNWDRETFVSSTYLRGILS